MLVVCIWMRRVVDRCLHHSLIAYRQIYWLIPVFAQIISNKFLSTDALIAQINKSAPEVTHIRKSCKFIFIHQLQTNYSNDKNNDFIIGKSNYQKAGLVIECKNKNSL